jgi:hypothetical protein
VLINLCCQNATSIRWPKATSRLVLVLVRVNNPFGRMTAAITDLVSFVRLPLDHHRFNYFPACSSLVISQPFLTLDSTHFYSTQLNSNRLFSRRSFDTIRRPNSLNCLLCPLSFRKHQIAIASPFSTRHSPSSISKRLVKKYYEPVQFDLEDCSRQVLTASPSSRCANSSNRTRNDLFECPNSLLNLFLSELT